MSTYPRFRGSQIITKARRSAAAAQRDLDPARLRSKGGENMHIHREAFRPNIEWERYRYTLPKSGAEVEIIREIVMNDDDLEHMDLSRPN